MDRQPSIFIGSSTENLEYARALEHVLDHDMLTSVWSYGVFLPGMGTLDSLRTRAASTDFAALFLSPDDETLSRGEYLKTPRDNLVFELGLFIGRLGPERAFFLCPREEIHLPSDLQGITPITYRTDRRDDEIFNAVSPAATLILQAAKRLGPRPEAPPLRAEPVTRGKAEPIAEPEASPAVLAAIAKLGALAAETGAVLQANRKQDGRFEIVLLGQTGLGRSVEIELGDAAAVQVLEGLGEVVRAG